MTMHVSFFYDEPFPSQRAAPIQILNTCRALAEQGVAVTVYVGRLEASGSQACLAFYGLEPHDRLEIIPFGWRRWSRLTLRRRLRNALRRADAGARHVVLSRGEPGLALFMHLRHIKPMAHERRVYEAHRLCFTEVPQWYAPRVLRSWRVACAVKWTRAAERCAVETADGVVTLTSGVLAALHEHFQLTAPTMTLPSGTRAPQLPLPGDTDRDLDIVYAGKLTDYKGVPDLIRAMRFVPDHQLHVVGGTRQEIDNLKQEAAACGVAERVRFHGFVKPPAVRALYGRARVGVCPLSAESEVARRFNSPLKVLDMMACGTPIVATDLPSVRELLTHDQTALLSPSGQPEALAASIRALLHDRQRAKTLATEALRRVPAYTWEARARRLSEFLSNLP